MQAGECSVLCCAAHPIRCLSRCCRCGPPPPRHHHPDQRRQSPSGGPADRQAGGQTNGLAGLTERKDKEMPEGLPVGQATVHARCEPLTSRCARPPGASPYPHRPTSPSPPSPSSSSSPLEPISSEDPPSNSSELSPDMPVPALTKGGGEEAPGAGAAFNVRQGS